MVDDYFFAPFITPHDVRRQANVPVGIYHGAQIRPIDPLPGQPVKIFAEANATLNIDHLAVYFTIDGKTPSGNMGMCLIGNVVYAKPTGVYFSSEMQIPVQQWTAELPGQADGARLRYRLEGWNERDSRKIWYADAVDPIGESQVFGRIFEYKVDRQTFPQWIRSEIVYHIFVDRFAKAGNNPQIQPKDSYEVFWGGDLWGILEKLDYIQNLGVTMIWLSPICESPTYHSYNPSSYTAVSSHFGGADALLALSREAHRRGMKLMLDFVANHTSDEHPIFVEANTHPESESRNWYSFGEQWPPNGYMAFFSVKHMPQLRTDLEQVRAYLNAAARRWIRDFGADALRLDYVVGPNEEFWSEFQSEIKDENSAVFLLGEITVGYKEIERYAGKLDGYMNFPVTRMLRQVFAQRSRPLSDLVDYIIEAQRMEPATMQGFLGLDNHDMHRFMWLAENDLARLSQAAVFQFSLPWTPIIYYGTEIGLNQTSGPKGRDAYARPAMNWGNMERNPLLELYKNLIAWRKTEPEISMGKLRKIILDPAQGSSGFEQDVQCLCLECPSMSLYTLFNLTGRDYAATIDELMTPQADTSSEIAGPKIIYVKRITAGMEEMDPAASYTEITIPAHGAIFVKIQNISM